MEVIFQHTTNTHTDVQITVSDVFGMQMFNSSVQSSKQQLFTICSFTVYACNVLFFLSCI